MTVSDSFYILRVSDDSEHSPGFRYVTRIGRSRGRCTHFNLTGSSTFFPDAIRASETFSTLEEAKRELRSLRRKDKSGTLIKVEATYTEV